MHRDKAIHGYTHAQLSMPTKTLGLQTKLKDDLQDSSINTSLVGLLYDTGQVTKPSFPEGFFSP